MTQESEDTIVYQILITDANGMPRDWTDYQDAVCYHARGKVLWTIGDPVTTFLGGKNAHGIQSKIDVAPIIGVSGPLVGQKWLDKTSRFVERNILYARDRHICCYCGQKKKKLTIDHVKPKSRWKEFGMRKSDMNTWMNAVSSCVSCNHQKADRTPEEAGMQMLYVPYTPSKHEKFLLEGKNILADQMDFLAARIPKTSKLFVDGKIQLS
jgi:hypothetical protein